MKQAEKPEPKPTPPDAQENPAEAAASGDPNTPQEAIGRFLEMNNVSFDDFKDWMLNAGHYKDADKMKVMADLPPEICQKFTADGGRALARCVKIFGKPA